MKKQKEIEQYVPLILERLRKLNPLKIIIFGSYATGIMEEDSDLDILIVLNEDIVPSTYDEKLELKLKVRKLLRDINQNIPIDILVYTRPEYEEFVKQKSSFSQEIENTGKILYEAAS